MRVGDKVRLQGEFDLEDFYLTTQIRLPCSGAVGEITAVHAGGSLITVHLAEPAEDYSLNRQMPILAYSVIFHANDLELLEEHELPWRGGSARYPDGGGYWLPLGLFDLRVYPQEEHWKVRFGKRTLKERFQSCAAAQEAAVAFARKELEKSLAALGPEGRS